MLLFGLSTGHEIGLGLAVAGFAGFSLIVSMLVPRYRPQFPGRGLGVFLSTCVVLFVGMLFAMEFLGKESEEAKAEGGAETTQTTATTTESTTTTETTTQTETTAAPQKVDVSETEFKITLPKSSVSAGSYTFEVKNDGNIAHDFVVEGNGVNEKTKTLNKGESASVTVDLKPGTYDLYCSIPGHKEAGMDLKLNVS